MPLRDLTQDDYPNRRGYGDIFDRNHSECHCGVSSASAQGDTDVAEVNSNANDRSMLMDTLTRRNPAEPAKQNTALEAATEIAQVLASTPSGRRSPMDPQKECVWELHVLPLQKPWVLVVFICLFASIPWCPLFPDGNSTVAKILIYFPHETIESHPPQEHDTSPQADASTVRWQVGRLRSRRDGRLRSYCFRYRPPPRQSVKQHKQSKGLPCRVPGCAAGFMHQIPHSTQNLSVMPLERMSKRGTSSKI